jgi:hypothetical protein
MLESRLGILDGRRQDKVAQLLADHLRMEEWFGFDGHGAAETLSGDLKNGK